MCKRWAVEHWGLNWCLSVFGGSIPLRFTNAFFDPLQTPNSYLMWQDCGACACCRPVWHPLSPHLFSKSGHLSFCRLLVFTSCFSTFSLLLSAPVPSMSPYTLATPTRTHAHAAPSTTCYLMLQRNCLVLCKILLHLCFFCCQGCLNSCRFRTCTCKISTLCVTKDSHNLEAFNILYRSVWFMATSLDRCYK